MKKAAKSRQSSAKTPKTYPVPEYMDDDLKPIASKLDVLQRHAIADKLERQALQLRGMNQPKIKAATTIQVSILPQVKKALCLYADKYGKKNSTEENKLMCGAKWFLETGLQLIKEVDHRTQLFINYRDAEGLEDSAYSEELIRIAVDAWTAPARAPQSESED